VREAAGRQSGSRQGARVDEPLAAPAFYQSDKPEPHYARTREILARHPEIRDLVGRNPWTLGIIVMVCAAQVVLTWQLSMAPWWVILITAYTLGALFTHALWAMIHECVHCRVLPGETPNRLAGMLANLTMIVPTAASFGKYHLKHHMYQGIYDQDADLPSHWEVKLFGGTRLGRCAWLAIFPILMIVRPSRLKQIQLWDRWLVLNIVIVVAFDIFVLVAWGPMAILYMALSMLFALGLNPLGARWIQEHYTDNFEQETYSYYGPLNAVQLNIGYHNEHHDFPGVPWNRLPALKALAHESYDNLHSHQSWTRLLIDFAMSGKPDLSGRIIRSKRNPQT